MHNPLLPRNSGMDIYSKKNTMELQITNKDLNSYYEVTRCLLKKKAFLPLKAETQHNFEKNAKRERLVACQNIENHDKKVSLIVTKAKAAFINHTLTLINKLGRDNEKSLLDALETEHKAYSLGKMKSY